MCPSKIKFSSRSIKRNDCMNTIYFKMPLTDAFYLLPGAHYLSFQFKILVFNNLKFIVLQFKFMYSYISWKLWLLFVRFFPIITLCKQFVVTNSNVLFTDMFKLFSIKLLIFLFTWSVFVLYLYYSASTIWNMFL